MSKIKLVYKYSLVFAIFGLLFLLPVIYLTYVDFFYIGEWFSKLINNPQQSIPQKVAFLTIGLYLYIILTYGSLFYVILSKIINDTWDLLVSIKRALLTALISVIPFILFMLISLNVLFHLIYRLSWEIGGPPTNEDLGQGFVFSFLGFIVFALFLLPVFLYMLMSMVYFEDEDTTLEDYDY